MLYFLRGKFWHLSKKDKILPNIIIGNCRNIYYYGSAADLMRQQVMETRL